jgi:hypothetical protein
MNFERVRRARFVGVAALLALSCTPSWAARQCDDLVGLQLGTGRVVSADQVAQDQLVPLAPNPWMRTISAPKPFCRVKAQLKPSKGSDIGVEVWLPSPPAWNGKLLGIGNGGFAGSLDAAPVAMRPGLLKGYVTAATDTGHIAAGDSARWALNAPDKVIDYGHRANHVTAVFAKDLIRSYYGRPAGRAYFKGCSNGGREALMEARRYPADYDGIVAGAPAAHFTGVMTQFVWDRQAMLKPGAAGLHGRLSLLHNAVLARCDAQDGVKDGVVNHPPACRFDPSELQCRPGVQGECLTAEEVQAAKAIYQGPRDRDGRQIFPGMPVSAEGMAQGWDSWITAPDSSQARMGPEFFRYMVHADPKWSPEGMDFGRDYALAKQRVGAIVDSNDPDISAFIRRGGKLILYNGWADAAVAPESTIAYYDSVRQRLGDSADEGVRFFMAPGMGHCFGGSGPGNLNTLEVLESWVEEGKAPDQLLATKPENALLSLFGSPTRTVVSRPVCAWPKVARWKGTGSTDEAGNFICAEVPQ